MDRGWRLIAADEVVFSKMAKRPSWSMEDAAIVLAGYDRDQTRWGGDPSDRDIQALKDAARWEDALKEAVEQKKLEQDLTPAEWIALARERELPVPTELGKFFPDRQQDQTKEKPLQTKERESLLKLIITMAVYGYRYEPNARKSDVPAEIVRDLDKLGLSLDADTVRKWLREAAELLPNKREKS